MLVVKPFLVLFTEVHEACQNAKEQKEFEAEENARRALEVYRRQNDTLSYAKKAYPQHMQQLINEIYESLIFLDEFVKTYGQGGFYIH